MHSGEEAVPVKDFQFILFVVNVRSGSTDYRKNYKSNKTRRIYKYSFHQVKQTVESDIKHMH